MYEAIIFDWDGTIADTKQAVIIAFQKSLREIGCCVSDEFLERLIGIGARNMFRKALESTGISFEEKELDRLVKKKIEVQLELSEQIELFDGAMNLLKALHTRIKIALATMSNRELIIEMTSKKGIDTFFEVIITADETLNSKPNPEIFLKCSKELECPPEKCIVIEDSIFGVIAAKEAKMKCIAIPSGSYSEKELRIQKPDLIIESINEKKQILNFIFGDNSLDSQISHHNNATS